jgi:hypothetical protein
MLLGSDVTVEICHGGALNEGHGPQSAECSVTAINNELYDVSYHFSFCASLQRQQE